MSLYFAKKKNLKTCLCLSQQQQPNKITIGDPPRRVGPKSGLRLCHKVQQQQRVLPHRGLLAGAHGGAIGDHVHLQKLTKARSKRWGC